MKMRVDEQFDEEATWSPGIRLDLGELEMAFEDLLALQPGSELEVEAAHPIRTYLRVGHSQLAVGELEVREGGIVVKIVEVL
jgi:flagellar motor switch/type III secretory pathway protein FliN